MTSIIQWWELWKKTAVGQEALAAVDREAAMFQAYTLGTTIGAQREKQRIKQGLSDAFGPIPRKEPHA